MLEADTISQAITQETLFFENRITQWWDGRRLLGERVAQALGLHTAIAWDIYLLFPPGSMFSGQFPPQPAFWMHQLDTEPRDNYLEQGRLLTEVEMLVNGTKGSGS